MNRLFENLTTTLLEAQMEKVYYEITDEYGNIKETKSIDVARKSFRAGCIVVEYKVITTYLEQSVITLTIATEIKSL